MSIRDEVRSLPAYDFTPRDTEIKLDQNEMPRDLPEPLRGEALARIAAAAFHRYPEMHAGSLRARLAERLDWPADGIVVTGGSNVLIQLLIVAAGLGRRVLTVQPTFSVYGLQARVLGTELTEVPLAEGFALPTAALLGELETGDGVVFLADPAAPTANRHRADEVERVVAAALERGWTPVLDEAYVEFSARDHRELLRRHPGAVALRTFSKAHGLGGVRLGYALTDPATATHLRKVALPFSVSALQVAVGSAVLDAPEVLRERVAAAIEERERLLGRLRGDPAYTAVEPFPSDTNFILFRTPDAGAIHEALAARGVLVRRQDHLPGLAGCLRVSVGTPEENDAFLRALAAALPGVFASAAGAEREGAGV